MHTAKALEWPSFEPWVAWAKHTKTEAAPSPSSRTLTDAPNRLEQVRDSIFTCGCTDSASGTNELDTEDLSVRKISLEIGQSAESRWQAPRQRRILFIAEDKASCSLYAAVFRDHVPQQIAWSKNEQENQNLKTIFLIDKVSPLLHTILVLQMLPRQYLTTNLGEITLGASLHKQGNWGTKKLVTC